MITSINQLVRRNCAGYKNGDCIHSDDKCLVLNQKRCRYFERAVLPPIDYQFSPEIEDIPELHKEYAKLHKGFQADLEKLRKCECGRPLAKGRQLCDECRKKRKRERNKQQKQKSRKRVV